MTLTHLLCVVFSLHAVLAFSACPIVIQDNLPTGVRTAAAPYGAVHHHKRVLTNSSDAHATARIVNGVPPTGELRHYVVKLTWNGVPGCTGTLINRRYVLSAAHCVEDDSTDGFVVMFYDADTDDYTISRQVANVNGHKQFEQIGEARFNDIMLLELEQPAPNSAVAVTLNVYDSIPNQSAYARAAGFGITHHDNSDDGTLYQVDMPTRSHDSCAELEADYTPSMHICAGYKCGGCDTCHGDSGGPLFMFDGQGYVYQIGITAYGRRGKCAEPGEPGVYTRVSHYHDWIRNIIKLRSEGIYESDDVSQIIIIDDRDECPK